MGRRDSVPRRRAVCLQVHPIAFDNPSGLAGTLKALSERATGVSLGVAPIERPVSKKKEIADPSVPHGAEGL